MICIMGMIFFLSHQPGDFADLPQFAGLDKLLHAFAYGSLAASFLYGLQPHLHKISRFKAGAIVILFSLASQRPAGARPGVKHCTGSEPTAAVYRVTLKLTVKTKP